MIVRAAIGSRPSPSLSPVGETDCVYGVDPELTQPAHRRLIEAGQLHDVLYSEPLLEESLDRGRGDGFRVGDGLLGTAPLLPGDLDVDRRVIDALLAGQLVWVEPQAGAPGPPSVGSPEPDRDLPVPAPPFLWGPPLP